MRRLAGRCRCLCYFFEARGKVDQRPQVIADLAGEKLIDLFPRTLGGFIAQFFGLTAELAEYVRRSHRGILNVGACLSIETQCLIEIEDNDRGARKFEQKITKCSNGNLMG